MNCLRALIPIVTLMPSLGASTELSLPPGIAIRLTMEGPVFVDHSGMTLYRMREPIEGCNDHHGPIPLESSPEGSVPFSIIAPDINTRRTCLQKHPPLAAPDDASPVGRWSIYLRKDGLRQWAYDNHPVFTSIKDRVPGEVNDVFPPTGFLTSPWVVVSAPLVGVPAGIAARKTAWGLALASPEGQTLYYPSHKERAADPKLWQPLAAAVLATANNLPDWSIVSRTEGSRQWAYKGKALYTYALDRGSETAGNQVFGDVFGAIYGSPIEGWNVALIQKAPQHPAEITTYPAVEGDFVGNYPLTKKVYVDAKKMTLYAIYCNERTADRLECDDLGDSPRYWLSFCGGEERCAETWHPVPAPPAAKSIDGIWSVIVINRRHPWQVTDKSSEQLSVWAYRGRPVFTYAHDLKPGDHNANTASDGAGAVMYARLLLAYDSVN
jgi:predicted lipoprotein with Yx(FWY)xxD motif